MDSYEIGPYSTRLGLATDIVSAILLSVSIIASSVVVLAVYKLDNKNKLRARVLIGLFGSHIWAGIVFLSFIFASFAGHHPTSGTVACEVSAFLIESAIWAQYLFAIAVAIVSFCILLYPLKSSTLKLERVWGVVFVLIYALALGMAGLESGLQRAVYIGGFCWNGSERNLFNELVGCAPRVLVFFVILGLYFKIYWYLRKRGRLSNANDNLTASPTTNKFRRKARSTNGRLVKPSYAIPRAPVPKIDHGKAKRQEQRQTGAAFVGGSPAPWETLRLSGLSRIADVESNIDPGHATVDSSGVPAAMVPIAPLKSFAFSIMTCGPLESEEEDICLPPRLAQVIEATTERPKLALSERGLKRPTFVSPEPSFITARSTLTVSTDVTETPAPSTLSLHFQEKHTPDGSTSPVEKARNDDNSVSDLDIDDQLSMDGSLEGRHRRQFRHASNPYATGHGHTPYRGSVPVAEQRAHRERYETLHGLLTRKAAVLFLLFPLTYFMMTVICLLRLVDDYAAGSHPPSTVIHAISRWALFLQGPLDCLTYGVMAFKIKKDVGKEIKRRWGQYIEGYGVAGLAPGPEASHV